MTALTAALGRSWRLCTAAVVTAGVAVAPASYAGRDCGPTVEPAQVENLAVTIGRVSSPIRLTGVTPVEVEVRREVAASPVDSTGLEGAYVSLRVLTSGMTSFVDATLDETGRATVHVTLDQRTRPGAAAVIAADVWADNAPQIDCQQFVREHGYAEAPARVSR